MIIFSLGIKANYFKYANFITFPIKLISKLLFKKSIFSKVYKSDTFIQKKYNNKNFVKNEPTILKKEQNTKRRKTPNLDSSKIPEDLFGYKLPSLDMLLQSSKKDTLNREVEKINNIYAKKLEETLSEYGVEGKIVDFKTGPIVTLFEFVPNAGIKTSKVVGLADDIARAMSTVSARISSQPGKTSIGIEIPNTN